MEKQERNGRIPSLEKNYFDDVYQLAGRFSCLLSDGIVFLPSFVIIYSISLADQIVFCNPLSVVCVST